MEISLLRGKYFTIVKCYGKINLTKSSALHGLNQYKVELKHCAPNSSGAACILNCWPKCEGGKTKSEGVMS